MGILIAADGTLWFAKENALTSWLGGSDWEVFQRDPLLPGPRTRRPNWELTDLTGSSKT